VVAGFLLIAIGEVLGVAFAVAQNTRATAEAVHALLDPAGGGLK
jgi:hypothetical protein